MLYALLMCVGKLAVGVPVVLWSLFFLSNKFKPHPGSSLPPTSAYSPSREALQGRFRASLYPALFVGVAMVSRGEIGLLIAQIARNGTASSGDGSSSADSGLLSEEGFLVCVWAILLCTLTGPICVGMIVRKYRHRVVAGIWR